jgi:hypothetical protein
MVSNAPTSFGSGDTQFGFGGQDNIDISNAQGSFGQSLSKEIPLSQRYGNIKSAISGGNYMDALKQVSGAAIDNPLTTTLGLSSLAAASVPGQPEQLPGESMEEYNARVEQWKTTLNANLGNTPGNPYLMPASANNPYYGVQAANGGRIGYGFGGIGSVAAKMDSGDIPAFKNKGFGGMFGQLIANNPQIFKQVQPQANNIQQIAKQSFFNPNMNQEEDTRYKLPASARNPMYGMMANGGRMGYAYGNSVQEGIMAAPQIANQMGMPVGNPRQNQSGVSELDYRDQGGFVPPIGIKEKEDDIPAMLSNNEFVFTADAVKNAGGGDPNVGAQKMYAMMKQLENGGMA